MQAINRRVIEQFRTGGEVDGMHRDRLLLLTTVGARSGKPRTAPMMFHEEHGRVFVIAANGGAESDPQWYRNLLAEPRVTVEIDGDTYEADAVSLTDERPDVWARITELYPFFAEYERGIDREIPVVELVRE